MRSVLVSFGSANNLAKITSVRDLAWDEFAKLLTANPPETNDKASAGWFIPAEFSPCYRDAKNLVARYALTFDYDSVTPADVIAIQTAFKGYSYSIYTTASHLPDKPRVRVVMPTTRGMGADEFCAVSRKTASWAGIELAARESHSPAQMAFLPTVKPGGEFKAAVMAGQILDPDAVLALYSDWTDRTQWPTRKDHDSTYRSEELPVPARDKPGVIGDFNRAFSISEAIERFELPYSRVSDTRWSYTDGSRAEGMRTYDQDSKAHNENDTNPARGQHSAFDLVRIHRFSELDKDIPHETPITERPSFKAMCVLANEQPEILAVRAGADFEILPPLAADNGEAPSGNDEKVAEGMVGNDAGGKDGEVAQGQQQPLGLARKIDAVIRTPTIPRWLIKDVIERGVIAVMAGKRGSYKSFLALDWAMTCALRGDPVYVISAEGGDFDRRAKAWLIENDHLGEVENIPLYVVEKRMDLSAKAGIEKIREDCKHHGIHPVLFVLDTFSKLSGGLDENDNSKVKAFIGLLDNGLKRAYDATVLLIAHTGHTEQDRPRGASALGADTDAEYIATRDAVTNTVALSRQRFKASPELPPIHYAPEIVELDYVDEDGAAVTSLVMSRTEEQVATMPRVLLKKHPGRLYAVARESLAEKDQVVISDLLDKFVEVTPHDGKARDRRRRTGTVALDVLLASKLLVLRDAGTVALSNAGRVDETDFTKEKE